MCVKNSHALRLPAWRGLAGHRPLGEQQEAQLAADGLLGCLESLFQSEIKEEKTQKLDTVVFCYLTFTGRPLSLQLLSSKPLAKIMGED